MITVRRYGKAPYSVAVIHGGPGAAGEMAPVARQLSKKFGVVEPLQTQKSVLGQAEELESQLSEFDAPFILVGHSWGAWLSLLYAKNNPDQVRSLILVGCPPFTEEEAKSIMDYRLSRLDESDRHKVGALLKKEQLSDDELTRLGVLMEKADIYEKLKNAPDAVMADAEIGTAVWQEARQMRISGEWMRILGAVKCPTTLIHGRQDPHPYKAVQRALEDAGASFDMALMDQCGHTPWKEAKKMSTFYKLLTVYIK